MRKKWEEFEKKHEKIAKLLISCYISGFLVWELQSYSI